MTYKIVDYFTPLKTALLFFGNDINTLVVLYKEKLLGTFTIGDFIETINNKKNINSKIGDCINKNFIYLKEGYTDSEVKKCFNKNKKLIDLIVLDKLGKIKKIINRKNFLNISPTTGQTNFVVMAGGEGKRLRPFTNSFPKALWQDQDGEILIKKIFDRFNEEGFTKGIVCLNYKADIIKACLKYKDIKLNIDYMIEKKKLGTVGALTLIKKKVSDSFFLTNCDLIINYDYSEILNFHNKKKSDLTIVTAYKNFEIPYGICDINKKGSLKNINEKPKFNYLISTGMYVINKKILSLLKIDKEKNMDLFIKELIRKNKKINIFPIPDNCWQDYGSLNNL